MNIKSIFKEKILADLIMVFLFAGAIVGPCVYHFAIGRAKGAESTENRNLAQEPTFGVGSIADYPSEFEAYFNDNMPFRSKFISLNTRIDYYIYKMTLGKDAFVGRDNWLFYSAVMDGDPISSYYGSDIYSEEKLEQIAAKFVETRDYFASQGMEFVLFIAPNKERIYYEQMPDWYGVPGETYRALQVVEYLRANTDIKVVYPYEELMAAKENLDCLIWLKTDTHWNSVGAYVGTVPLIETLGVDMPDVYEDCITVSECEGQAGDLACLLNLGTVLGKYEQNYTISGYEIQEKDPRTVYVYRDSFGEAMAPYLESAFENVRMMYFRDYTYADLCEQNPDVFVYETVERYLGNFEEFDVMKE